MSDVIDGERGPRTIRAIRKHLAEDAERRIIFACISSDRFRDVEEIRRLLDHVKADAALAARDEFERKASE